MKLMPHQNATKSVSELYVWRPESIYQEGVELTIFLVSQMNQRQYRCNPLGDWTIYAGNKLIELMAEQKKEIWAEMNH